MDTPQPPFLAQTPSGVYLITNPAETIQRSLLQCGKFEPLGPALALAVVKDCPGVVVDVGANIGTFCVPLALKSPQTEIFCFEPQRAVHLHLGANIFLNRLRNVYPENAAVGAARGRVRVPAFDSYVERYTGSVTLDPEVAAIRSRVQGVAEPSVRAEAFEEVELVTLSDRFGEGKVAFLKIDVEGMELDVLKGAAKVLERSRPFIFSEAWTLREFQAHRNNLLAFLDDHGYVVRNFGDDFAAFPDEQAEFFQALVTRVKEQSNLS